MQISNVENLSLRLFFCISARNLVILRKQVVQVNQDPLIIEYPLKINLLLKRHYIFSLIIVQ